MKLFVLILLVVSTVAMKREECTPRHFKNIRSFFGRALLRPIKIQDLVGTIKLADDWQICEHDLVPRICVLDFLYGEMLNSFRTSKTFENDLEKISLVAEILEEKCNTRNIEPGKMNNL